MRSRPHRPNVFDRLSSVIAIAPKEERGRTEPELLPGHMVGENCFSSFWHVRTSALW
jgi:hypothetical protein